MISKTFLEKILNDNVAIVTFTKVDGSQRVMKCTRDYDTIPTKDLPVDNDSNRVVNEDVLPVWDLDKKAWRSFRVDSVIGIENE